jgi:hypothetical protein
MDKLTKELIALSNIGVVLEFRIDGIIVDFSQMKEEYNKNIGDLKKVLAGNKLSETLEYIDCFLENCGNENNSLIKIYESIESEFDKDEEHGERTQY